MENSVHYMIFHLRATYLQSVPGPSSTASGATRSMESLFQLETGLMALSLSHRLRRRMLLHMATALHAVWLIRDTFIRDRQ